MAGPNDLAPPGGGVSEGGGGVPAANGDQDGRVKMIYANKVSGLKPGERPKLNVLDIFLERKHDTVSFRLSKDDLAKLLFKKIRLDPMKVLKIDTPGFGKIHIEMDKSVQVESLINIRSFDIKDGLRTKFYRPHHHKDTLVTVSWIDLETPDEFLIQSRTV